MATDFDDDVGQSLLEWFKRFTGKLGEQSAQSLSDLNAKIFESAKNWFKDKFISDGMNETEAETAAAEAASREAVCLPFGTEEDAAYFAQVCRENDIYVAPFSDEEGKGYVMFAEADKDSVEKCLPTFEEVMGQVHAERIAAITEPVTEKQLENLKEITELPKLPERLKTQEELPNTQKQAPNHTQEIADKVLSARDRSQNREDFERLLAKENIGITTTKSGEMMFYEARVDETGKNLPYDREQRDWAVGADTLKEKYGVDATHDWFEKNKPGNHDDNDEQGDNLVRDRWMKPTPLVTEEKSVPAAATQTQISQIKAAMSEGNIPENEAKGLLNGLNPTYEQAHDLLGKYHALNQPFYGPPVAETLATDGSLDQDGRTPDLNQGIESHDGRDTNTQTARMEYEATGSGDVPPSRTRHEKEYNLESSAKEARAASRELSSSSGRDARVEILDHTEQQR